MFHGCLMVTIRAADVQPYTRVVLPDDDTDQIVESVTKSQAVLEAVVIKTNGGARVLHVDDQVEVLP